MFRDRPRSLRHTLRGFEFITHHYLARSCINVSVFSKLVAIDLNAPYDRLQCKDICAATAENERDDTPRAQCLNHGPSLLVFYGGLVQTLRVHDARSGDVVSLGQTKGVAILLLERLDRCLLLRPRLFAVCQKLSTMFLFLPMDLA